MSSLATLDNPDIARIHDFWYGRPAKEWFMPAEGFDTECRNEFGHLVRDARTAKLDHWQSSRDGSLALLILLDQFTRNVFRDTPDAFSSDSKALEVATKGIANDWDKQGTVSQAHTFVSTYLPLMHNENLLSHIACRALLELLVQRCTSEDDKVFTEQDTMSAARGHMEVIQKFGRYPSRNKILGRESTEAELEFLRQNPSGFAQKPAEPGGAAVHRGEVSGLFPYL